MPLVPRLTFAFATLALICLLPAVASAEDIVITSGTWTITNHDRNVLSFSGENFSFSAQGSVGGNECFGGCPPGRLVRTSTGTMTFNTPIVTYNGVTYTTSLTSPTTIGNGIGFTGPFITADPNNLIQQVPVTFSGNVTVYDNGIQLFTLQLSGSGIGTFEFFLPPGGGITLRSATYQFQPQATPEPATLLLLGTGLAGAVGAARRRRRKSLSS